MTVVNPVLLSYTKFDILTVGVDKSTSKTSEFAAAAVVMIPVYCCVLLPSATKPKFPNDEFEFVIEDKRLYRVMDKYITIKYERERNEEAYNTSWAQGS